MKFNIDELSWWKIAAVLVLLALLLLMVLAWPLFLIWALNTLFPVLAIQYSFWTYIAVCILNLSTFGGLAMTIRNSKN